MFMKDTFNEADSDARINRGDSYADNLGRIFSEKEFSFAKVDNGNEQNLPLPKVEFAAYKPATDDRADKDAFDMLKSGKLTDVAKIHEFVFDLLKKNRMNGTTVADELNKKLEEADSEFRVSITGPHKKHYPVHNYNANNKDYWHVLQITDKQGKPIGGDSSTQIHWRSNY